jgi:hypothetical protein
MLMVMHQNEFHARLDGMPMNAGVIKKLPSASTPCSPKALSPGQTGLPRSFVTKPPNRCVNVFLLFAKGYESTLQAHVPAGVPAARQLL